jgi:hypothetical protein
MKHGYCENCGSFGGEHRSGSPPTADPLLAKLADALEAWGRHDDGPLRRIPVMHAVQALRNAVGVPAPSPAPLP